MRTPIAPLASLLIVPFWFELDLKATADFEKETVSYKEVGQLRIKADIYRYPDAKIWPEVTAPRLRTLNGKHLSS